MADLDLLQTGGAGGVGAIFGAFLAWAGFKSRLDGQEARIIQLENDVVYADTCKMCKNGTETSHVDVIARMDRLEKTFLDQHVEIKRDIRTLTIAVVKMGGEIE
jgi:hypothetical protein